MTVSHAYEAQVVMPGISARQRNERAHIRQGMTTDELTRTKAARLRGLEADIRTFARMKNRPAAPSTARNMTVRSGPVQCGWYQFYYFLSGCNYLSIYYQMQRFFYDY